MPDTGLTPAAIDAMPAGREMDALVAEHVFGWKMRDATEADDCGPPENMTVYVEPGESNYYGCAVTSDAAIRHAPWPAYSTTWDGAGMVLEKMHGFTTKQHNYTSRLVQWKDTGEWTAGFIGYYYDYSGDSMDFESSADTAPLAICRAALKAVCGG